MIQSSLAQRATTKRKANGHEQYNPKQNADRRAMGYPAVPMLPHNPALTSRTGKKLNRKQKRQGRPS